MGDSIEEKREKVVQIKKLRDANKSIKAFTVNKTIRTAIDGALIALASGNVSNDVIRILLIIALALRAGWNVFLAVICGLGAFACRKGAEELEEDIINIK